MVQSKKDLKLCYEYGRCRGSAFKRKSWRNVQENQIVGCFIVDVTFHITNWHFITRDYFTVCACLNQPVIALREFCVWIVAYRPGALTKRPPVSRRPWLTSFHSRNQGCQVGVFKAKFQKFGLDVFYLLPGFSNMILLRHSRIICRPWQDPDVQPSKRLSNHQHVQICVCTP